MRDRKALSTALMPDTPKDDLEPWLIPEQEWVLIPVTPVEPDEEPKPEGD